MRLFMVYLLEREALPDLRIQMIRVPPGAVSWTCRSVSAVSREARVSWIAGGSGAAGRTG
jgi:hypothetical protein